jgi:hypothetical protein
MVCSHSVMISDTRYRVSACKFGEESHLARGSVGARQAIRARLACMDFYRTSKTWL